MHKALSYIPHSKDGYLCVLVSFFLKKIKIILKKKRKRKRKKEEGYSISSFG